MNPGEKLNLVILDKPLSIKDTWACMFCSYRPTGDCFIRSPKLNFTRNWSLASVNFGSCVQPHTTGKDVRLNVIKLLPHASGIQRAPGCFARVWKHPGSRTIWAWSLSPNESKWTHAKMSVCVRMRSLCVCVFAFLLFPGLPQACDPLARAWFIHLKSFNLMGYILSKHCLINCGLCTLFFVRPIVLPGGTRINTHRAKRLC